MSKRFLFPKKKERRREKIESGAGKRCGVGVGGEGYFVSMGRTLTEQVGSRGVYIDCFSKKRECRHKWSAIGIR